MAIERPAERQRTPADEIEPGMVQERLKAMEGSKKLPISMGQGAGSRSYAPPQPISVSHANAGFSLTAGSVGPAAAPAGSSPTQGTKVRRDMDEYDVMRWSLA